MSHELGQALKENRPAGKQQEEKYSFAISMSRIRNRVKDEPKETTKIQVYNMAHSMVTISNRVKNA
jgi:hypothetical protein